MSEPMSDERLAELESTTFSWWSVRSMQEATAEIRRLRSENEAQRRGQFICVKCGLRKDGENDEPGDF